MASRLSRVALAALTAALVTSSAVGARRAVPPRLTDAEFWNLIKTMSEPDGVFPSENLVSDEMIYADVVPALLARPKDQGVYLGVGPEQNFTYISALQPPMAFILDIRRGNLHLQLLYKALFELSSDRSDFVSRLFVKPRPGNLSEASSAADIMQAYWNVNTDLAAVFDQRQREVHDLLVNTHHGSLSQADLDGIAHVYHQFYWFGPSIMWAMPAGSRLPGNPRFKELLEQRDAQSQELSFLSSESRFAVVKSLESRNLVVPVVGDFAGPSALRSVGTYIRDRGAQVGVFYVSEVEAYLAPDGKWPTFCANLATLPVNGRSALVRPALKFGLPKTFDGLSPSLVAALTSPASRLAPIAAETAACR